MNNTGFNPNLDWLGPARSPCISFDWDDTLSEESYNDSGWGQYPDPTPIIAMVEILESYHALGCRIIICTARPQTFQNVREIDYLLKVYGLKEKVEKVIFTHYELKGPFLKNEGVVLHYDDCPDQLQSVTDHNMVAINSMIDREYKL